MSDSNSVIIELSVTQASIRWFVVQCLYIISSHAVNQGFELGGEVRELGCISVEVRDSSMIFPMLVLRLNCLSYYS